MELHKFCFLGTVLLPLFALLNAIEICGKINRQKGNWVWVCLKMWVETGNVEIDVILVIFLPGG
jgi:hypothetical protein